MSNSMLCTNCKEFFREDEWNYCPICGKEDSFTDKWQLDDEGKLID